jgi:hypothetical protein
MRYLVCAKSMMPPGFLPEVQNPLAILQNMGTDAYLPYDLEACIQTPIDDPTERDWPGDQEPWNLFERHMPLAVKSIGNLKDFKDLKDLKDLEKAHTLSDMLESWSKDKASALNPLCRNLETDASCR